MTANQAPDSYWINAPITNVLNTNVQALLVYEDVKPYKPPKGHFWTWSITQDIVKYWKHTHGHHHRRASKMRMISASGEVVAKRGDGGVAKRADTALEGVVLDESKLVVSAVLWLWHEGR
jgi:hypothetical protein